MKGVHVGVHGEGAAEDPRPHRLAHLADDPQAHGHPGRAPRDRLGDLVDIQVVAVVQLVDEACLLLDSRARTGAPTSYALHDKGLSTMIDWRDRDSKGASFSAKQRAQIYRLRKWQIRTRVHSSLDRNLAQAMTEIDRLSSQLGLSHGLREHAARMYRKLIAGRLWRSRSIDATAAAAVYAACRHRGSPRSIEEIAEHSRENKKKISAHYRMLVTKLKIRMPISSPENYVPRFISDLKLPSEVQKITMEILSKAKKVRGLVTGRDPRGLAAAAIYIASIMSDHRVTQRDISRVSGVTEVTIRNRYKELVSRLELTMAPYA